MTQANYEQTQWLLDRLIICGGPPRSGTTLLIRLLNLHRQVASAIDGVTHESFALYFYRKPYGLIHDMRQGQVSNEQIRRRLIEHLVRDDQVYGVADSPKVQTCPLVPATLRPSTVPDGETFSTNPPPAPPRPGAVKQATRKIKRLVTTGSFADPVIPAPQDQPPEHTRREVPLERFRDELRLCIKSPEISFFMPELLAALPSVKFVLVYRSILEVADSMWRRGNVRDQRATGYHRKWQDERDGQGRFIPPPGVYHEWHELWQEASDFQRDVIYATSYFRALAEGMHRLPADRVFIYHHPDLRREPRLVLDRIARFLEIDPQGFGQADSVVRDTVPKLDDDLIRQYHDLDPVIHCDKWLHEIQQFEQQHFGTPA